MNFGFRIGATSDVGAKRDMNQDSFGTRPDVVVVADGMGGHRGGEVASAIAITEVLGRFSEPQLALLVEGVERANTRILDESAVNPELRGMGTTVCALAIVRTDVSATPTLAVINVGDSRVYRLTGNVLEQLTEDHSLVEALVREGRITREEAEVHPKRNVVTRALGVTEEVDVDHFHFLPKIGDRYLLASDGLFDEVSANDIANLLAASDDPQDAADQLVHAANNAGGSDNITTVVVDVVDEADARGAPVARSLATEAAATGDALDVPAEGGRNRWSWRR